VRSGWREGNAGALLFGALFGALARTPQVRRIECQLPLLEPLPQSLLSAASVRPFERLLMKRAAEPGLPLRRASTTRTFRVDSWGDGHGGHCDAAATVLSLAYAGHSESQMNDLYRTQAGASRLVKTLSPAVSFVAFDMTTGSVAGLALASFVAEGVGHVNELCVIPAAQGAGLGYELLRRSIDALRGAGAHRITLTVTAANKDAVAFYARCGFSEAHRFFACAWDAAGTPG
jgi:ribosomal protein S18 acetylase RimI-like enzyme